MEINLGTSASVHLTEGVRLIPLGVRLIQVSLYMHFDSLKQSITIIVNFWKNKILRKECR